MPSHRNNNGDRKAQDRGHKKVQAAPGARPSRRDIAETTLAKLEAGSYTYDGTDYPLGLKYIKETVFYPADSDILSAWPATSRVTPISSGASETGTVFSILEISTLEGARQLTSVSGGSRVGVLNFASAKNPGGGWLGGAQAQEESIARSSTIYPSLMTPTAQQFYNSHKRDSKVGFYSHAMIFSPRITFFRDDAGDFQLPIEVDVVTSCAVNAGVVRRELRNAGRDDESALEAAMKERMGRILCLFENRGVKDLVLGSFGTGVFRNKVDLVASIWAELLVGDKARFRDSFRRVVFAIIGHETFNVFKDTFEKT